MCVRVCVCVSCTVCDFVHFISFVWTDVNLTCCSGQWSACFPLQAGSTCGAGTRVRNVYCMSALDEAVPDVYCSRGAGVDPPGETGAEVGGLGVWIWGGGVGQGAVGLSRENRKWDGGTAGRGGYGLMVNSDGLKHGPICPKMRKSLLGGSRAMSSAGKNAFASSQLGGVGGVPAPESSVTCSVPCPGDCDVSTWTEWTTCSATCGAQGGTQSRTRKITGAGGEARRVVHMVEWRRKRGARGVRGPT